jgi:hypothetical protein
MRNYFASVVAKAIPFDNSGGGTTATNLQDAMAEVAQRSVVASYAAALKITRKASVNILRGEAVRAVNSTYVTLATKNGPIGNSIVLGFADADAAMDTNVNITLMGVVNDPSFSVFLVNSLLFLDINGAISDVRPSTGSIMTIVGSSLGGNDIFVSIQKPVQL